MTIIFKHLLPTNNSTRRNEINLKQLRELAEAATQGEWHFGSYADGVLITDAINNKHNPIAYVGESAIPWDETEDSARTYNNASFIAKANPQTLLALLDLVELQHEGNVQADKFIRDHFDIPDDEETIMSEYLAAYDNFNKEG